MFRKILYALLLLILIGGLTGWYFMIRSATKFTSDYKIIYVYHNAATPDAVLKALEKDSVITQTRSFNWLAARLSYWEDIKPGKYKIPQGESLYGVVRQLRSGKQEPVSLVISRKIRQKQDFARLLARNFEVDSLSVMQFLNNTDSLRQFGLDSTNWMTAILHDTYSMSWTWPLTRIFKKIQATEQDFWQENERTEKAHTLGFSKEQIYTLASIVMEETNKANDKPLIASTYMNRLKTGMKLQADPTVKFAMKDFALNRIMQKHLTYPSPYNTYQNPGLPPGPICTVDKSTLDAVLNAPQTDYLYFVANANLEGGSSFSSTYEQHLKLAHEYQDSLTAFYQRRAVKKSLDSLEKARKQLE